MSLIAWEWYVANYAPLRVLNWYRKVLVSGREMSVDVEQQMMDMLKYVPDDEPKKAEWAQRSKHDLAEAKKRLKAIKNVPPELTSRSLRSGVVMAGVSLLLLGFIFQLIGAWPT